MTRYRITYTLKGSTESFTGSIVERDESRAKKYLKTLACEEGNTLDTISSIEVEVENVPASKLQEREALEEIKAIVDSLGEDSYIKMAFDGCFKDAENNIDDDAAYSMKARWEKAQEDAAYFKRAAENFSGEAENLRLECEALRNRTLASDDLTDVNHLIDDAISDIDSQLKAAAENIIKYAENPASVEFQQAVIDHRALTSRLDHYKALADRIEAVRQAGA